MAIFSALRAIREFERAELPFIRTIEDLDLVREIGFHQEAGKPLTLKALYTLRIGAVATIQRRLSELKKLGVVEQVLIERDRRSFALRLSAPTFKAYERYLALLRKVCGKRETMPGTRRRDPRPA